MANYMIENDRMILRSKKEEFEIEDLQKIKSVCLWSPSRKAWISRAKISYTNGEMSGSIVRFINLVELLKIELIENETMNKVLEENTIENQKCYAKKLEDWAIKNDEKSKDLRSSYDKVKDDTAFWTQPSINSGCGKSFTNYRKKVIHDFDKSFDKKHLAEKQRKTAVSIINNLGKEKQILIKDNARYCINKKTDIVSFINELKENENIEYSYMKYNRYNGELSIQTKNTGSNILKIQMVSKIFLDFLRSEFIEIENIENKGFNLYYCIEKYKLNVYEVLNKTT